MSEAPTGRAGTLFKRFVMFVVLTALGGAVAYLLAERNQRSFTMELTGSELVVLRGRLLPTGYKAFQPSDRAQAQAYAPLQVGGETGPLLITRFDDRDELDRALFTQLRIWIEPRIETDDPERLNEGLRYLHRAEQLSGLNEEQRRVLKDLQARIAYFEGRARLDESVTALREAVGRLKLAAESRSKFSRDAGELFERVSGLTDQISRATRVPLSSAAAPPFVGRPEEKKVEEKKVEEKKVDEKKPDEPGPAAVSEPAPAPVAAPRPAKVTP